MIMPHSLDDIKRYPVIDREEIAARAGFPA